MASNIGGVFIVLFWLIQTIANMSALNRSCLYDLFISDQKHSLNLSVDAEIVYKIYEFQSGCNINVSEIYENITKHVSVDRAETYVTVAFICSNYIYKEEQFDVHFTSSGIISTSNSQKISVQITLGFCSIFMNELEQFQKYGRIWSIVTTNSSRIYPGASCSSIRDVTMLSSIIECIKQNNSEDNFTNTFFWEICEEPFEQLFNLRLQGCSRDHYRMLPNSLQSRFPKLQTLWLKYINLTSTQFVFPWTNVYIDSSDADIIAYLSNYKESKQKEMTSIARSIDISDCDVQLNKNIRFMGHITKIVINNFRINSLNGTVFRNVNGMTILDLSGNNIRDIDKNMFLMQNKLKQLLLFNNNIETLSVGVFDDLYSLLYLDLSSNRISELNQRVFKHLVLLEELNLESNYITSLPSDFLKDQVQSIGFVFLSNNPLITLPLNAFYAPKVELVDIRRCNINESALSSLLDNINVYELQTGYSESLTYDPLGAVGKRPLKARSIDLTKNKVKDIPIDLTNAGIVSKLRVLLKAFLFIFDDNPLDCTCNVALTGLLAEMYVKEGHLIYWKCMFPIELRGRLIATIEPNETYCPVYIENCPIKCACFERVGYQIVVSLPERVRTFVIDCRNVNMTYLPKVLPSGRLELWFKNASLADVAAREYLKNTTVLDISNNRINTVSIGAAISLRNILTLKLDHNNLTYLPQQLTGGNATVLTLSNNPFICDCNMRWMKSWLLKRTSPVTDWNLIECTYELSHVKQFVSVPDSSFTCEKASKFSIPEHVTFPSIVIGSILFVLVSLSLLVYFQRFFVKVLLYMYCGFHAFDRQSDNYENMPHDAFIIYSHTDTEFIRTNLADRLDKNGYKVADIYGDFIVGFSFLKNIEKFINISRRVIFCWSQDMMENELILSAWNIAYEKVLKSKMKFIILLVDKNLDISTCYNENLKRFLKSGRFIKKNSQYLYASVEYLMPRTGMNETANNDRNGNADDNTVHMLQASDRSHDHPRGLVYISYPDDLDFDVRQQLVPFLSTHGHNIKVLEHDFTPGADIRDEIHEKMDISSHFIFILSQEVFNDEVKMFILATAISKSMLSNNNYLLLFTSGPIHDVDLTNELDHYFNHFVTGRFRDSNFRERLLQALNAGFMMEENTIEL